MLRSAFSSVSEHIGDRLTFLPIVISLAIASRIGWSAAQNEKSRLHSPPAPAGGRRSRGRVRRMILKPQHESEISSFGKSEDSSGFPHRFRETAENRRRHSGISTAPKSGVFLNRWEIKDSSGRPTDSERPQRIAEDTPGFHGPEIWGSF